MQVKSLFTVSNLNGFAKWVGAVFLSIVLLMFGQYFLDIPATVVWYMDLLGLSCFFLAFKVIEKWV